jgi:pimeloyl-ACP methyl ester carboxylesterase
MTSDKSDGGRLFGRPAEEWGPEQERSRLPVIPIVFLPGIMGSNLRVKNACVTEVKRRFEEEGKVFPGKAWDPPSIRYSNLKLAKTLLQETAGADSQAVAKARLWDGYGPKLRQVLLNPETVEVDERGFLPGFFPGMHEIEGQPPRDMARKRGWGSVYWDTYGPILQFLELHLNPTARNDEIGIRYRESNIGLGMLFNGALECIQDVLPTREEIAKAARFRYPVHAAGYNWTQSNLQSAKDVMAKVQGILQGYQQQGLDCRQVILVTHSMGGLVGRILSGLAPDLILGVVHGAMPAIGAPDAYQIMAAGVQEKTCPMFHDLRNVAASLGGRDAAETTPVMANAPGALELLPSFLYPRGWLKVEREVGKGQTQEIFTLPTKDDPYTEIYREKEAWWRLVDPELLDPANLVGSEGRQYVEGNAWKEYKIRIFDIEDLHKNWLGKENYHKPSIFFYSKDKKTFSSVRWLLLGDSIRFDKTEIANAKPLNYHNKGSREILFPKKKLSINFQSDQGPGCYAQEHSMVQIQKANGHGDGTVPIESGAAPRVSIKYEVCLHGFDHADAYKPALSKFLTMIAVCKLVGADLSKN